MKKYIIAFLLTFTLLLIPKDTFAQTIYNTGITLKNSNNTSVLYSGGINEEQTNIAYLSGKIEFPFSTSVNYDNSYSFTMDYYINIPYNQSYQNLGFGNPELYINSNGLVQQTIQISNFGNTLQACGTLACTYRINLSFTFGTNAVGTLYLAIPITPPHAIYGWHYNNIDLTSYGQNTSNSDIINNNNQNTQNIINNNNQTTQQIINSQNQINNNITDTDTSGAESNSSQFFQDFFEYDAEPNALMDLLRLPITFLQSLNNQCSPITLNIPYFNTITIPCIQSYLSQFLPTAFLDLIRLIVNGILGYHLLMALVRFISDIKDPNNDELEVIDL